MRRSSWACWVLVAVSTWGCSGSSDPELLFGDGTGGGVDAGRDARPGTGGAAGQSSSDAASGGSSAGGASGSGGSTDADATPETSAPLDGTATDSEPAEAAPGTGGAGGAWAETSTDAPIGSTGGSAGAGGSHEDSGAGGGSAGSGGTDEDSGAAGGSAGAGGATPDSGAGGGSSGSGGGQSGDSGTGGAPDASAGSGGGAGAGQDGGAGAAGAAGQDGGAGAGGTDASSTSDGSAESGPPKDAGADADASLPAESGAITVQLCPETAVLLPGDPLQFTAMVEGTSDTAVYYSADWGDAGGGVLGSNGALKAPSQPGTYVIKAVSHADGTASASATVTVVAKARPVFSGTVADPGNHQGVIYVETFKSWPQAVTSLSAPGAFELRGISAAPGQQVTVRAFRDTLGVGQYVVGADPVGQATFTFSGGDQAGLSITLNDPPAPVLTAPSVVEVRPLDETAIVGWQRIRNANDDEVPDHYRVYAGTTSNVGPGGNNVQVRTVRGGTSSNAIVDGLTNGQSVYFGVAPVARGVEGPITVVGPFVIGTPPGGVKVSGQVDFTGVPATGPLYAVVYTESPKRAYVQTFAQPTSPTIFQIPGVLDGIYQMVAIIDLDGDGEIGPLDPATFRHGQSSFFTVNGLDVSGRNLVIPSSPALAHAITSHERDEFGEHYQVALRVDANLELPIRAVVESGPGVVPPIDMGFEGESGSFRFDLPSGTSPPTVGAVYRFDVTYLSGVTCNLKAEITGIVAGLPTAVSPKGLVTAQPSFTWTPPDPAPNISRWSLEVREAAGGNDVWETEFPGAKTSATYNEDGRGASLVSGHTYRWTIRVVDENGNVASDTQSFSVP